MLNHDQISRIMDVLNSKDSSFNELVRIARLDPKRDFRFGDFSGLDLRGADLSGFDFTGADLRGCIIDNSTMFSDTTLLADAEVEWVIREKAAIVDVMTRVEHANGDAERRKFLDALIQNYNSSAHIHLFLKQLLEKTRSIEEFFTLLDYFEVVSHDEQLLIARQLIRFSREASRARAKKTVNSLSPSAFSRFVERLKDSNSRFANSVLKEYLVSSQSAGRVSMQTSLYDVEADYRRFVEAVERTAGETGMLFWQP